MRQILLDDGLHQADDGVGCVARRNTEMMMRKVRDIAHRIDDGLQRLDGNQRCPTLLHGFFDFEPGDGIRLGDVRADKDQGIRVQNIVEGDGPSMRPLHALHGMQAVDMPIAGAAVDIVGADGQAEHFLKQIQFFVGATAGDQSSETLTSMSGFDLADTTGDVFQRFFPGRLHEHPITPNERMREAMWITGRMESKKSSRAQVAVVASCSIRRVHLDEFLSLRLHGDPAPISAVPTDGVGSFQHPWPVFVHRQSAGNRSDRTDLNAAPAKLAIEGVRAEGLDFRHRAATDRCQSFDVHDLIAVSDAAETLHAAIHLRLDERTEIFFLKDALGFHEPAGCGVLVREVLEIALAPLIADRTVQRMVGKDKLQHRLMGVVDHGGGGAYAHPFVGRCAASGLQLGHLLDFNQTHTAIGVRLEFRVIAEMRNHDTDTASRFDHQGPFRDVDRHPVDRDANHLCSCLRHR